METVLDRDPIAITMGDPCGIGPEILVRLAAARTTADRRLIAIGDAQRLRHAAQICGLALEVVPVQDAAQIVTPGALAVIEPDDPLPPELPFGRIDRRGGAAAFAYLNCAIDLALTNSVAAIVTGPLNKEALMAAGVQQPGHTEILAERSGTRHVAMMLATDELRVILVSIHVALSRAIEMVTIENELRAIRLAEIACRAFGIERPRIAVAGLNPHAGEEGLFGREDMDIIAPAILLARKEGLDVSGPWPGDTVFMRARRGEFDIVVAQFHDQGLIPVKLLGIDQGVNVTVGLPFVRTSVDHGTAFDIAGTGRADPASLAYALEVAERMTLVSQTVKTA